MHVIHKRKTENFNQIFKEVENGLMVSCGLDNRASVWV